MDRVKTQLSTQMNPLGNTLKYTVAAHLSTSLGAVSTFQGSSLSASLNHPYIWITKLVCAPSIQSTVPLSGSLPFLSSSPSPYAFSTSSLTWSDSTGSLQTFRFSLLAFWWGDTRHMVESHYPGGILIEKRHKGASQRETTTVQADSDGVRQREVKTRDRHQKKYNKRESEWDRWNKGRWKSKLKKRKEIVLGTVDHRKKWKKKENVSDRRIWNTQRVDKKIHVKKRQSDRVR